MSLKNLARSLLCMSTKVWLGNTLGGYEACWIYRVAKCYREKGPFILFFHTCQNVLLEKYRDKVLYKELLSRLVIGL